MPNYELPVPVGTMVYVIEDCYCTPFWIKKCKMRSGDPAKKCTALALIPTENRKGRAHCLKVYLRPFDPVKHLGQWGTKVFPAFQSEWLKSENTVVFEENMRRAYKEPIIQASNTMSLNEAISILTESDILDNLLMEFDKARDAVDVLVKHLEENTGVMEELNHPSDIAPSEALETLRDPDLWNALCECCASTEDAERFRTAISVASICLTAETAAEENNMSPREAHAILSDSSIWEAYWNNDISEEDNNDLCSAVQVALKCLAEKF